MSQIKEYFAVDETVEYYRERKEEAIAVTERAGVHLSDEASRIDALDLACAIIALAQ